MGEMSPGEEAANYPKELLALSSLFPLRDTILPIWGEAQRDGLEMFACV